MTELNPNLIQPNFLEKLIDQLLRPFPARVSLQVSDLRGGTIDCSFVRTPPSLGNEKSQD